MIRTRAADRRQAMTLVEILFALLLLTIGILTVSALVAQGLRTQQQVRYRLYASAKAMTLVESLAQSDTGYISLWAPNGYGSNQDATDIVAPGNPQIAAVSTDDNPGVNLRRLPMFSAPGRFDLDQAMPYLDTGAIPVPPQIARRIDSPGDALQGVLDRGGMVFYADPVNAPGGGRVAGRITRTDSFPSEMQDLVFAVVGPAQHGAMDMHPLGAWPHYEVYPFPPQAGDPLGTIAYDLSNVPITINGTKYNYSWVNPHMDGGRGNGGGYESSTWGYFYQAAARGDRWQGPAAQWTTWVKPWQDGYQAFMEMTTFAWTPIAFKLSVKTSGARDQLVPPLTAWPNDNLLPPFPGASRTYAERITECRSATDKYFPEWYNRYPKWNAANNWIDITSPALSFTNRPPAHRLLPPFDPVDAPSGATAKPFDEPPFAPGMREGGKPLPPSLQMRRYYRRMALRLWYRVNGIPDSTMGIATAGDAAGAAAANIAFERSTLCPNPLLGVVDPVVSSGASNQLWPHPAKVLALSHLAHAAMMVTGLRPPYGLETDGAKITEDNVAKGSATAAMAINTDMDGLSGVPGTAGPDEATEEDRQMAMFAHETCMRWATAFASENPYDSTIPRPANRPAMMDRPIYQYALNMVPENLGAHAPFWPVQEVGSTANGSLGGLLPAYYAPQTSDRDNWERLLLGGISAYDQDPSNVGNSKEIAPRVTVAAGAATRRATLLEPFDPGQRCRELVFWAVNW